MNQYEKDLEFLKKYVVQNKAMGSSNLSALFYTKKTGYDRKTLELHLGALSIERLKETTEEILDLINGLFADYERVQKHDNLVWFCNDEEGIVFACRIQTHAQRTLVALMGNPDTVDKAKELLSEVEDKLNTVKVKRIFAISEDRLDTTTTTVTKEVIKEELFNALYPDFTQSPGDFWDGYDDSNSPIVFLLGQPGTGKTSYLKYLMAEVPKEYPKYLIDSLSVLRHPMLFNFLRDQVGGGLLIIEDADNLLGKREEGNVKMTELLNMTSGIAQSNLKIIITTNLPHLSHVDEALLRHGRTHAILEFRPYTAVEAETAREALDLPYIEFDEGETYTLVETTAPINTQTNESIVKKDFGFLPA